MLNDPTKVVDFNNTESGSTHVDDYWARIDLTYSPLEGWRLSRHVRIGCFLVQWESPLAYAERISETITATECVQFCNKTQAYLQLPSCRCALDEALLPMTEVLGQCGSNSWEVFREYDYRSSMSPSTYDVARRLLYSIVTVRLPAPADPSIRNYIHAVNALESRPEFDYDVRLDRMLFNSVWDFAQSRMVALSLSNWGGTLDFSVVSYNSSSGTLQVSQSHFPIEDEIVASGDLVRDGMASAEGLGTVDILFGTYYTVVPATIEGSTQVVHIILAIDIDMRRVITSVRLPVTLVNIQINSLNHELYGAGADYLSGQYAYYHICTSENLTQTVNNVTTRQILVDCTLTELGELPAEVNHLYFQSAAIDHQTNYAWFTYKEASATGRPRILEYHQTSRDYVVWPQESLPENAVFSSLIQTAPRIIFTLFPPRLLYARFNTAGTKIFLAFDAATLRGAIPIDTNSDDIPDSFNEADKATRAPCDQFIDQFTMTLIPGSMCQWTSDADFYIEVAQTSVIAPGDLARIKAGTVYRGEQLPSGVYQFSQPSSDFVVVEAPLTIPNPVAEIGGMTFIDVCTELTLDGTQSRDHGFRGSFTWALVPTIPEQPEPHLRQLETIIDDAMAAALPVAAQVLRIPSYTMQENTLYNFSMTVQSFWDPSLTDTTYFSVSISAAPVPPMEIFGPSTREQKVEEPLSLVSEILMDGCLENFGSGSFDYEWRACKRSEAILVQGSTLGCNTWGSGIDQTKFSGVSSRSLYVLPFGLDLLETYIFTMYGQVTVANGPSELTLSNVVSVEVEAVLGSIHVFYYGGNGFSTRRDREIVVDFSQSVDDSDPANLQATITYSYGCFKEGTTDPCFATQGNGPSDTLLVGSSCATVSDPQSGLPLTFEYRNKVYNHGLEVSYPPYSNVNQFCLASTTSLIFQPNLFEPGSYVFVTNASKVISGVERVTSTSLYVTVLAGSEVDAGRNPLLAVFLDSPQALPVFPGSTIRLRGEVTNPQNDTTYSFAWSAYRFGLNPQYNSETASVDPNYAVQQYAWAELSAVEFNISNQQEVRTPSDSNYLVIAPDVLWPGVTYKLRITALDSFMQSQELQDASGYAEYTFRTTGLPPSGGVMTASNLSGNALETEFLFSMTGWGSEDRPLRYQFSYIQDFESQFAEPVELTIAFSDRNFIKTKLPQGLVGSQNLLRLVGTVKSAVGAVATAYVDVSVNPPSQAAIDSLAAEVPNLDPETAIVYTTLLAETPAVLPETLPPLAQVVENKMFVTDRAIARTPEMVSATANMLTVIAQTGAIVDSVVSFLERMVNLSVDLNLIKADGSLGSSTSIDIAGSLFTAIDAIMPGVVPSQNATARRLEGEHFVGGMVLADWPLRQLQSVETRTFEEMYNHFQSANVVMGILALVIHKQLYPAEVPLSFFLPGQDIYLGKSFTNVTVENIAPITELFDVPSLERPGMPSQYNYRYIQFKKFPYDFLAMPGNQTLGPPPPANETNPEVASLVPTQVVNASERLWHAVLLTVTDEDGNESLIDRSLVNATFSMLPKIAAYDSSSYGNVLNPSTCYWVDLANGNFSEAAFDSRGSIFSEDSCITMHTDFFAIFADDLAAQLEIVQQEPGEFLSQYDEEFTTTANVVTATLVLVACAGFVMVSVYVDEHDAANKVTPLDSLKTQVIDRQDPKEKVLGTLFQSMRRNHLVIGWNYFHLKLTRVRRAGIFITAIFATEALAVLQHSLLAFKAESAWGASGLVAAVLVFPIVQFLEFCFEWLPQSRMLAKPPPRSAPAKPIPLKEQAKPKVFKYPKRPAVGKVRPPEPKVLPRAPHSLQLPVMPTLQLKATGQSLAKGRPQPPARPPGQLPRPPQEPPPPGHLLARAQSDIPELASTGFSEFSRMSPGTIGPFGLTLPELPPLPQGNLKAIADGKPAPSPPPKGSTGPRPPKTPPPVNKMFFVAPKGVPMAVPALPAPPSNQPRACPPLPKLPPTRTVGQLSTIRSGGSPQAPPPAPPPHATPRVRPAGLAKSPATTPMAAAQEDHLQRAASLPGAVSPEEVVEPRAEDVEQEAARAAQLVRDPEHTMPARDNEASSSSPNRRRRPVVAPATRAEQLEMVEVDLPNIPRAASSKSTMPLALPKGMQAYSQEASAPGRSPLASSPVSLSPGADNSPLRLAGSNLRMDVPKQASDVPAPQGKHAARFGVPVSPPSNPKAAQGPEAGDSSSLVRRLPSQTMPRHPPKPPPKVRGKALLPTPPSEAAGPPPAHAIVLPKGKPQDFATSSELQAVVAKAKPPPPLVHPPSEPLPSFVYRGNSQALQTIMDSRERGPKASALEPLPPKAPPLNDTMAFSALPPIVKEYVPPERGPKPVPEFVVKVSVWTVYLFVFWIFVYSISIIGFYGVYMASSSIWATYAATLCGCLLNFGILESMKCIILGCVELVKHETVRRQAELDARRTRMALKEQRLKERRSRLQEIQDMHVSPPLMG